MNPIIKVEGVSYKYTLQWAVKDISFEIPTKGIYGLLGSNGAGKSTLMNIICGVIKTTKGRVYIGDSEVGDDPIKTKSKIGFLPQQPPVYSDLTVWEYLQYAAELRGVKDRDIPEFVDRAMEMCEISHFRDRLIKNLSGGFQQRVGIAQAIIHKPEIVIFDEPSSGLDPVHIVKIQTLIKEIAKEHTVIFSSHILSQIKAVCDHIFMVEQGRIVFDGSMQEFNSAISPNSIFVTMKDAPALSSLEIIKGVRSVEELGDCNYRIFFTEARAVMDRIVKLSAENKWRLTEIRLEKKSMESIFAQIAQYAKEIYKVE